MSVIPDDIIRKALFTKCSNMEELRKFILFYFDLDIPNCIVDEESISSPMHCIWELYEACLTPEPAFSEMLAWSARDAFKTLGAAIFEVLAMIHMDRNISHLAAVESQSGKAASYIKGFINKPYLKDYIIAENERKIQICHYEDKSTGSQITQDQYKDLPANIQSNYIKHENYAQVIVATLQGTNSSHTEILVCDEIDTISNPKAYIEAKMIPSPKGNLLPITLYISTRKTSFGLVQKEIDNAPKTGVLLRHWNIIDCVEACPPSRHLPNEPRVSFYYSDSELKHVNSEEYQLLEEKDQNKYRLKEDYYSGCLKCPLAAMCKGRLATEQKSKSSLLKPIKHTINLFKKLNVETAQAQLMSRKAEMTGLVYPRLSPDLHKLTASQMANKMTGDDYPDNFTKSDLINLMKEHSVPTFTGIDWGFSHNYVAVSGAKWGGVVYVFDALAKSGLDPEQKVEDSRYILKWDPTIFADPEAPDSIKLFKRKGFKMKEWKKGSIEGGIDLVRSALRPALGTPNLFFLKDDPQVEFIFFQLSRYHYETDASGEISEKTSESGKDEADALRYLVTNVVTSRGHVVAATGGPMSESEPTSQNHIADHIRKSLGDNASSDAGDGSKIGKKGGITWSF